MGNRVYKSYQNLVSAAALGAALVAPIATMAGEVTLKSADGTVNLVGEFVDFSDNNYVIRTALGDLRIAASRVSCEGADCPTFGTAEADINIAGSDAVGSGIMPLILSGYAAFWSAEATQTATSRDGQFITSLVADDGFGDPIGSYLVTSSTSGDAFSTLLDRSAQIGMAARRITPDEARALRADGAGNMVSTDSEHIIAVDSLVVITHPSNPVNSITLDQLRAIYSGAITNWSQVGGNDAPIVLVDREVDTGTRETFMAGVYGDDAPAPMADTVVVADNNQMAARVNADENAVGFVSYAFQRGASALSLVNDCGLTMTPDAFSARTAEYALQRLIYLYTRDDTADAASMDLVDYASSAAADEVIAKAGFIDLGIDRRSQTLDGDRARALLDPDVDAYEGGFMREMLSQMVNYDRLSTTLRFRTGSQNLDPRGKLNLARLADYLAEQPDGTKIMFAGFTDSVGAFDSNRALSESRAEQVRAELEAMAGDRLGGIEMLTAGFGEIAPTACNTSEAERQINRRVEVWIETANG